MKLTQADIYKVNLTRSVILSLEDYHLEQLDSFVEGLNKGEIPETYFPYVTANHLYTLEGRFLKVNPQ